MEKLPIEKFYGVGKVTANKMHELHIFKGSDLKAKSLDELVAWFGKSGNYYYNAVRGIHHSEVRPNRIAKSIGVEETFWENIFDEQEVFVQLKSLAQELQRRSLNKKIKGKTLTLKIKYKNFELYTRSKTREEYFWNEEEIYLSAKNLWQLRPYDSPIRLLGLSLSALNIQRKKQVYVQLKLPFPEE